MSTTTNLDLTAAPPRSGRAMLGSFSWLARLIDKVRAEQAGTEGEYIAYCGLSMGFLNRCGVSKDDLDQLVSRNASDDEILAYFDKHVSPEQREAANRYVLEEERQHLDKQDREEGRL